MKGNQGCFLCNGPHRAKGCSKRVKLTALVAEDDHALVVADFRDSSVMNPMHLVKAISEVSPLKRIALCDYKID